MTPKPQSIADAPGKAATETCNSCDECQFSWYYSRWQCGDTGDMGDGMTLDNDIYLTVHQNCPLLRRDA